MLSIAAGARQICPDYGDTSLFPFQNDVAGPALAHPKRVIKAVTRFQRSGTGSAEVELVRSGHSVCVVQRQRKLCCVTGCHKTWQREVHHHRISYEHGAFGVSQAMLAVRDRHEANLTREVRDVEADPRQTIGADLHRTRKKRHRARAAHRERLATHRGVRGVSSLMDWPRIGASIQEASVIVADVHPQGTLAIEERSRIRRGVACELKDSFINRGQGQICGFAGRGPSHLDRNVRALARCNLIRSRDRDGKRSRRWVYTEPGQAYGTHGVMGPPAAKGRIRLTMT